MYNNTSMKTSKIEKVNKSITDKISCLSYSAFCQLIGTTNDSTDEMYDDHKSVYQRLIKYCRHAKTNNYITTVNYSQKDAIGRMYAINGIQSITKSFRGLLCEGIYIDYDMKNAFPTILIHLCKNHGISNVYLTDYVTNREERLQELAASLSVSRGEAKTIFISSMNTAYKKTKYNKKKITDSFYLEWDKEMLKIQKKLMTVGEYSRILKYVKSKSQDNVGGRFISYLLQDVENQILANVREHFKDDVLMFDGFMSMDLSDTLANIEKLNKLTSKYSITWDTKEHNTALKERFIELELDCSTTSIIADSFHDISKQLAASIFKDRLFYDGDLLVFKPQKSIWTNNEKRIHRELFTEINDMDLWIKGTPSDIQVNNLSKHIKEVIEYITKTAPSNNDFKNQLWDSSLRKMYFKNGYYDFAENKMMANDYNTFIMVDTDHSMCSNPTIRKEIYDRILNPIFTVTDESCERARLRDWWLHQIGRAMAGEICDKVFLLIEGLRDCGKGCLADFLIASFKKYVCNTNAENFLQQKNDKEPAKALSWMLPLEWTRLCIMNEMSIDHKGSTVMDGNKIKKCASGGDYLEARRNYQDEVQFRVQAMLMMMCNDMPEVKPSDALEKCKKVDCVTKFVPFDYPESKKLSNISYKLRDDSVKSEFIKKAEVQNEFRLIIFEAYQKVVCYPKRLEQEVNDDQIDDVDRLVSLFEFTANTDDRIPNSELKAILKDEKIAFSVAKMKKILRGKGALNLKTNKLRGLKCLRFACDDEEFESQPQFSQF